MELNELYKIYGELMVKSEILQNQINQVKGEINEKLNTPPIEEKDVKSSSKTS